MFKHGILGLNIDGLFFLQIWQLEKILKVMLSTHANELSVERSSTTTKIVPLQYRTRINRFIISSTDFLLENWKRIWILLLWFSANMLLFGWKFFQYKHRTAFEVMGYCVCVAKGAAEALKLNMAIILLPVCRNTITRLRSTFISSVVPFDDNINFHKVYSLSTASNAQVFVLIFMIFIFFYLARVQVIAIGIAIEAFIHTAVHLACDFPRLSSCNGSVFMRTLGSNFDYKQPTYASLLASSPGVTGIIMIIIMSFAFTLATHSFRRSVIKLPSPFHHLAGFNAFWYAHHLLVLVYILLIIHGSCIFLTKEWFKRTVSHGFHHHHHHLILIPSLWVVKRVLIKKRKQKRKNYRKLWHLIF